MVKIRGQSLKLYFFRCAILVEVLRIICVKGGCKWWVEVVLKKCFCVTNYILTTESEVSFT